MKDNSPNKAPGTPTPDKGMPLTQEFLVMKSR